MRVAGTTTLFLMAATIGHGAELNRSDFAYRMPLTTGSESPLYELAMPLAVYQSAMSPALDDVRVVNAAGAAVPYSITRGPAVNPGTSRAIESLPIFPLHGDAAAVGRTLSVSIRSADGNVDLSSLGNAAVNERLAGYLIDVRGVNAALDALSVSWADASGSVAGFSDTVTVESSDDLLNWRRLATGVLANLVYNQQRLEQNTIEFPYVRARFLRVMWPADQTAVAVAGVSARTSVEGVVVPRAQLTRAAVLLEDQAGESLQVDTGAHLPVDRITLLWPETNSVGEAVFSSRAAVDRPWRRVARAVLYRLSRPGLSRPGLSQAGDAELINAPIAIDTDNDRYWKVEIVNGHGGATSPAPQLQFGWVPHRLRFAAQGQAPFELVFGSATARSAQTPFDSLLQLVRTEGTTISVAPAEVGAVVAIAGDARLQTTPPRPWATWGLWVMLIAGVAVLGWFAWRLSRELDA